MKWNQLVVLCLLILFFVQGCFSLPTFDTEAEEEFAKDSQYEGNLAHDAMSNRKTAIALFVTSMLTLPFSPVLHGIGASTEDSDVAATLHSTGIVCDILGVASLASHFAFMGRARTAKKEWYKKVYLPRKARQEKEQQAKEPKADRTVEKHTCPICKANIEQDCRFCPSCGNKIEYEQEIPPYCTSCGKKVAKDDTFCPSCGKELVKPKEDSKR